MKITKKQLRRIIKEEMDIEDQRAMDMGIIPYPDGSYASDWEMNQSALLEREYLGLDNVVRPPIRELIKKGYSKEEVVEALTLIVQDAAL